MYKDIIKRLASFGYTVVDTDKWLINFLINKVTNEIKYKCNIFKIPDGLYQIAIDMVCGEFLLGKKGSGQLTDSSINTDAAIKQIKEGDTSITYAVSDSVSATFDGLIDLLMNYGKSQFITFRRLRW